MFRFCRHLQRLLSVPQLICCCTVSMVPGPALAQTISLQASPVAQNRNANAFVYHLRQDGPPANSSRTGSANNNGSSGPTGSLSTGILGNPLAGLNTQAPAFSRFDLHGQGQQLHTHGGGHGGYTHVPGSRSVIDLNLGSSIQSISGALLGANNIPLLLGGSLTVVGRNSLLTPAEYMAALGYLSSGKQTLTLNSAGQATGGTFQLPRSITLSELVVPTGVTGIYKESSGSTLKLSGDFINNGSFYLVSTSRLSESPASLSALNIINSQGALLSTVLPAGGLAGLSNLSTGLSLSLNAVDSILNYGSISSSSALSLTANNRVLSGAYTGSVLSASGAPSASIVAGGNLSITAPFVSNQGQISSVLSNINVQTSNLTNSGLIQAAKGNINISNALSGNLNINNAGGTISADKTLAFASTSSALAALNVNGGLLKGGTTSFQNKNGDVSVSVSDISRAVSFNAKNVLLAVSAGTSGLDLSGLDDAASVSLSYRGEGDVNSSGFHTLGKSVSIETGGSINFSGSIITTPESTGNGGDVFLSAGTSLLARDIITVGGKSGNGGNITLIAGNDISAGRLDASGGSGGNPGIIKIEAGKSGAGDATISGIADNGVAGGGQVLISSPGQISVSGQISAENGSVTLSGGSISTAGLDLGHNGNLHIDQEDDSNSPYLLNLNQLAQLGSGHISIEDRDGFVISGNCNQCLGSLSSLSLKTAGDYSASGTTLVLSPEQSFDVTASGKIATGSVSGGQGVSFKAGGALTVDGNLSIPQGAVVLNGDLLSNGSPVTLESGNSITAKSVSVSSGLGAITSGANLQALSGAVSVSSGGALSLLDKSSVAASANVELLARGALSVGSAGGTGVSLQAGALKNNLDPFKISAQFAPGLITQSGSVLIDSYQHGKSGGDVVIGSNVSMLAAGDGVNGSGSVSVISSGNVSVGTGSRLSALGGNLWLSAGKNVTIDHSNLVSVSSTGESASGSYSGGLIGILSGAPATDMKQFLGGLAHGRSGVDRLSSPIKLAGNHLNLSHGSVLTVEAPSNLLVLLKNNSINLNGGVIYIDPPANSSVTISNSTITASGPQITTSGGGTNGGGTNGGGSNGGGSTNGSGGGTNGSGGNGSGGTHSNGGTGGGITPTDSTGGAARVQSMSSGNGLSSSQSSIWSTGSESQGDQQLAGITGKNAIPIDTLEDNRPVMSSGDFCSRPQVLKIEDSVSENSWIIASSSCQPFTFEEHDGSLIVGTGPARFAPASNRTLLLREGKLLVITVDKVHVIRTPFSNITIPVNTAAIVEVDPQGMVRVADLAGGKASIIICRNEETLILSVSPGDQLVLAESAVKEEDFSTFAYPDVPHNKVAAWNLELSGLRGQKLHFDRQEMAQHEPLLHCSMGCVNQAQLRRIEQLMQSMTRQETVLKSMRLQVDDDRPWTSSPLPLAASSLQPVSFQDFNFRTPPVSLCSLNAGNALVKYLGRCRVSLAGNGLMDLFDGEALVCAVKKTVIRAGKNTVDLRPGTIVLVSLKEGLLKVRNLCEKKSSSVTTTVAGKRVVGLQSGQELIVGPGGLSLSRALADEPLGRRRLKSTDLPSGHTCISSEFSVSSLLQSSPLLALLLRSGAASDRALSNQIVKMAVCLSVVTASHGNFSTVNP